MAIELNEPKFRRLSAEELQKWDKVSSAIAGDSMNRQKIMSGRLRPVNDKKIVGQAFTISVVAGDNGAIHAAMNIVKPDEILVVDGNDYRGRAIWGGILNNLALKRKVGGVIIDGAVRDLEELRLMQLPIYFSGITPAGPHKGWGGTIGTTISCGDISVSPGDLIIGDTDGVAVVPLEQENKIFRKALTRIKIEEEIITKIESGDDLMDIIELPQMRSIKN